MQHGLQNLLHVITWYCMILHVVLCVIAGICVLLTFNLLTLFAWILVLIVCCMWCVFLLTFTFYCMLFSAPLSITLAFMLFFYQYLWMNQLLFYHGNVVIMVMLLHGTNFFTHTVYICNKNTIYPWDWMILCIFPVQRFDKGWNHGIWNK